MALQESSRHTPCNDRCGRHAGSVRLHIPYSLPPSLHKAHHTECDGYLPDAQRFHLLDHEQFKRFFSRNVFSKHFRPKA